MAGGGYLSEEIGGEGAGLGYVDVSAVDHQFRVEMLEYI